MKSKYFLNFESNNFTCLTKQCVYTKYRDLQIIYFNFKHCFILPNSYTRVCMHVTTYVTVYLLHLDWLVATLTAFALFVILVRISVSTLNHSSLATSKFIIMEVDVNNRITFRVFIFYSRKECLAHVSITSEAIWHISTIFNV